MAGGLSCDLGGAKMALNKGKTHITALPVNVPSGTNGGRLAYPSAAQDTENQRATTVRETPSLASGRTPCPGAKQTKSQSYTLRAYQVISVPRNLAAQKTRYCYNLRKR